MGLRGHVIARGATLAGDNDRAGLHQLGKDSLDGGGAFRKVHAGLYLTSGGAWMVVQELEYFVFSGHGPFYLRLKFTKNTAQIPKF